MGAFSDYMEGKIVDTFLRGAAYTPTSVYLALFTADPTDAGTGAEATYTNYVRMISTWDPFAAGQTKNTNLITFPANPDVASTTITHIGVFNALTGGNMLLHAQLTSQKILATGDVLAFAANACVFTLD